MLPRISGLALNRPADQSRGYPIGILLYPLSVLLLILAFPSRLDIVAAAWGILACGDGAATIAGRAWGRHPTPWQPQKSLEGLAAFVFFGGTAGVMLAWWTAPAVIPRPPIEFIVVAPLLAAVAAGVAETVPITLDDNLTVPAFSRALARMIPTARLKVIPGGHGFTIERWEDFNRAVLGFLRGIKR